MLIRNIELFIYNFSFFFLKISIEWNFIMRDKEFIKVAVIGCGGISNRYKLLTKFLIKNTKIIAGMDLVQERAEKIGGKGHGYMDIEELYKNEDFDVVYIATPHHLHKPMIKKAFEEGKHVFCEKPVTISIEDAREINQLDKKYNNLKLGFDYMYRYDTPCYRLAKGIQNGHLGNLYYANCNIYFSRKQKYLDEGPWRTKWETSGGGTLLIHGSHLIDVLISALGEPKTVYGKIDTLKFKPIEVEDVGFGTVEFENGVYANITGSMIISPSMGFGGENDLKLFGEKGRCTYTGSWPRSKLKWYGVKKFKIQKPTKAISNLGKCIKAFGEWVLNDKPFINTIEESSKVLRLIKTLYKSSETGNKEEIPKL